MSHSHKRIGRLWRWHRYAVHLVLIGCAGSGIVWLFLRELLDRSPLPEDRVALVTHGVTGFLALMVFGSVLPVHVRAAWRARRNRMSGVLMLVLLAILALTALGLYYGAEEGHDTYKWIHIGIGLGGVLAFPLHLLLGRRAD